MFNEKIKDLLYNLRNEFENEFDDNYKSDYKKQITNKDFDIMMEFLDRFLNKTNAIIDDGLKETNLIPEAYKLTFEDAVKCYLDNYESEEPLLTEEEIKEIAYKMIYKNEYVWEIINETIDVYIRDILQEREKND